LTKKLSKTTEEVSKNQNKRNLSREAEIESYQGVDFEQPNEWERGGSFTSGKKEISAKLKSKKGDTLPSRITGVEIRGRQVSRRKL
jgi:hypothetical protein